AEVKVVGAGGAKSYHSKTGYPVNVDAQADQVSAVEFDAVVVPGGYAPDMMRRHESMVKLVREASQQGKVVAAICHAGWMLATAAVLRDGRVVGCASEERFTRLKNDAGYPRLAIDALLEECGLTPADVDVVALAGARAASREWLNRVLHDGAYAREYYGVSLP